SGPRLSDRRSRGTPMLSHLLCRSRPRGARPAVLALELLESRCTPATFAYSAATQSLTVNAVAGEQISVAQDANKPAGNVQVSSNLTPGVFNDPAGNTVFVKNLTVKIAGGAGGPGQVSVGAGVLIAGNLVITSADAAGTAVSTAAGVLVGGSLSFTS